MNSWRVTAVLWGNFPRSCRQGFEVSSPNDPGRLGLQVRRKPTWCGSDLEQAGCVPSPFLSTKNDATLFACVLCPKPRVQVSRS